MSDPAQRPKTTEASALLPPNLVEAQARSAAVLTRANEVLVATARAVWESQTELFRLEAEQTSRVLVPLKLGEDPGAAISAYYDQWRDGSEKLIVHIRTVNELVRKCGWDLFNVYAASAARNSKAGQTPSS